MAAALKATVILHPAWTVEAESEAAAEALSGVEEHAVTHPVRVTVDRVTADHVPVPADVSEGGGVAE